MAQIRVQQVELTKEDERILLKFYSRRRSGQNIVNKASEMKAGETVFEKGEIITKNMVATLASFGYAKVKVAKRPKVAILATGSEIVDISEKPGQDQIRNSNSWMLAEFAKNLC